MGFQTPSKPFEILKDSYSWQLCVFSNAEKETLGEINENSEALKCVRCQMNSFGGGNGGQNGNYWIK